MGTSVKFADHMSCGDGSKLESIRPASMRLSIFDAKTSALGREAIVGSQVTQTDTHRQGLVDRVVTWIKEAAQWLLKVLQMIFGADRPSPGNSGSSVTIGSQDYAEIEEKKSQLDELQREIINLKAVKERLEANSKQKESLAGQRDAEIGAKLAGLNEEFERRYEVKTRLEAELEQKEAELLNMRTGFSWLKEEKSEFEKDQQRLLRENEQRKASVDAELKAKSEEKTKLEAVLGRTREDIKRLENQLNVRQEEKNQLENEEKVIRDTIEQHERQLEELGTDLKRIQTETLAQQTSKLDAEQQVKELQAEIVKQKEKKLEQNAKNAQVLEEKTEELKRLEDSLKVKEEEVAQFGLKVEAIRSEIREGQNAREKQEAEFNRKQEELLNMQKEVSGLENQKLLFEKDQARVLQENEQRKVSVDAELKAKYEEKSKLEVGLEQVRKTVNEFEKEKKSIRDEISVQQKAKLDAEQQVKELQAEIVKQQEMKFEQNAKNARVLEEKVEKLKRLEDSLKAKEENLAQFDLKFEAIRSEIREGQNAREKQEAEFNRKQEELLNMQKEVSGFENQKLQFEKDQALELLANEQRKASVDAELKAKYEEKSKLEFELQQVRKTVNEFEVEKKSIRDEISVQQKEKFQTEELLKKLQEEKTQLEGGKTQAPAEKVEKLEQLDKSVQKQQAEQAQLRKAISQKKEELNRLQSSVPTHDLFPLFNVDGSPYLAKGDNGEQGAGQLTGLLEKKSLPKKINIIQDLLPAIMYCVALSESRNVNSDAKEKIRDFFEKIREAIAGNSRFFPEFDDCLRGREALQRILSPRLDALLNIPNRTKEQNIEINLVKAELATSFGYGIESTGEGKNGAVFIKTFEGDSVGVFKAPKKLKITDFIEGAKKYFGQARLLNNNLGAQEYAEVVAAEMCREFGFGELVPEAFPATIAGQEGSFIFFLGGYKEMSKSPERKLFMERKQDDFTHEEVQRWQDMVIWNKWIENNDPHDGNMFVRFSQNGVLEDLRMIDHGNCFPKKLPGRFGSKGNLGAWDKYPISKVPFTKQSCDFILNNLTENKLDDFFDANPARKQFFTEEMRKLYRERMRLLKECVATGVIRTPVNLAAVKTQSHYNKYLKNKTEE